MLFHYPFFDDHRDHGNRAGINDGAEIDQDIRRPGLWAKAIAKAEGDEANARAIYIELRAQSILDEGYSGSVAEAQATAEEAARQQRLAEAVADGRYDLAKSSE